MQVADNKILRAKNEYLLKELRNYVPEHHMFQENNNQEETDVPNTEEKQLSFDLMDKYAEVSIEQITAFNLQENKFNVTREAASIVDARQRLASNPEDKNI